MGAHGCDSSHRPPNISSLDSPMESNDGDLWSGMPSGIQEDDLRVLRHDTPWYNCCAHLCSSLRCWGGLRESDLDALQRRQKGAPTPRKSTPFAIPQLTVRLLRVAAAEWSNAFSDRDDWGSSEARSGPGSTAGGTDPIGDVEMDDFHPHMDDYETPKRPGLINGGRTPITPKTSKPMPMQQAEGHEENSERGL